MSRRRTGLIVLCAVAITGVAASGWWWHRDTTGNDFARSCLPAQPDLSRADRELRERVASATRRVEAGDDAIGALAELANLYQANGHDAEASRCLQALCELRPRDPRWPHRLALILAGYGRLDDARPWFERALAIEPKAVVTRIRFADTLVKANRPDEAARHYARALELEPEHPHALLGQARIAIAAGNWREARRPLEIAAGRTNDAVGGDLLATVYERLGDHSLATAVRAKQKASGAFSDIPDPWVEELFDDCYDTYRISVASGAAAHRGDTVRANRWIERALSLSPGSVPTLFQRGGYRLRARDLDGARRDFQRCTEIDPKFSDGWASLYAILQQQGHSAEAGRILLTGLAHCPNSPGLRLSYARRLAQGGQLPSAMQEYRTSIQLRPEEAEAYVELAGLLFRQERIPEGVDLLLEAQRVEPDHPAVLGVLVRATIMLGDEPAARRWFERVRHQPRIAAATRTELQAHFTERFGHAP